MALLGKDQINSADDRKWEDVPVPEWGGEVRLLGLTGTERDAYEASFIRLGPKGNPIGRNLKDIRAKLLVKCLVDEDFERIYTDEETKDVGNKSGAVIDRLYDKAKVLSGISEDAAGAKAGNSERGQNEGSTSDSPPTSD
ncbi:hypothetical protein [Yinghuangia sp. YIM S09857]|uniref:hypothetical protein n=1 Tax=Yinghuangia sp. YIM S09857 TaxID=3436929 RepID=UPI003F530874